MELTSDQIRAIDSTLCIFETGRLPSSASYSTCALLSDGAGISYGKHQATDKSGTLDLIVGRYIAKNGVYSSQIKQYIYYLDGNQTARYLPGGVHPQWLVELMSVLGKAGSDPIMQGAQDEIFAEQYMGPALAHAKSAGLNLPLSLLVVYDTCIQSGPGAVSKMRNGFVEASPANGGNEKAWARAYIRTRELWLKSFPNPVVQNTTYRTKALAELATAENWSLTLPMTVRGVKIS